MRNYVKFQGIIAVLLNFLVFNEFTGCYSARDLTVSEISPSEMYLVHSGNSFFLVCNVVLTGGIVKGELVTIADDQIRSIKNHIYLTIGTVVTTENNFISVPAQSIEKIVDKDLSSGKTAIAIGVPALILGGAAVVGIMWALISFFGLFRE